MIFFRNPNRIGTCGHRSHLRLENLEELDLSSNKLSSLTLLRDDESGGRRPGSDVRKPGSGTSMTQSVSNFKYHYYAAAGKSGLP